MCWSERQGDEPREVGGLNFPGMCSGKEGLVVEHCSGVGVEVVLELRMVYWGSGPGAQDGLLWLLGPGLRTQDGLLGVLGPGPGTQDSLSWRFEASRHLSHSQTKERGSVWGQEKPT